MANDELYLKGHPKDCTFCGLWPFKSPIKIEFSLSGQTLPDQLYGPSFLLSVELLLALKSFHVLPEKEKRHLAAKTGHIKSTKAQREYSDSYKRRSLLL